MRSKIGQVIGAFSRPFYSSGKRGKPVLYITFDDPGWNANNRAKRCFDDKLGNFPVKFCYRRKSLVRLPLP